MGAHEHAETPHPAAGRGTCASPRALFDCLIFRDPCAGGQERAQAVARMIITAGFGLLGLGGVALFGPSPLATLLIVLAAAYEVIAVGNYLLVSRLPEALPWRRYAMVVGDLGIAGLASWLAGPPGLGLYPLFLWIIVGNGLRFGPERLALATLIGAPVFALAHLANGVALAMPFIFGGLLAGLLLLPRFMHLTLVRMVATNRELIAQKEQAEYLAKHDALTGLPNRHLLLQRLDHAIARARRNGRRLAVLFIDLDGFKRVNDSLGHDHGDELLMRVADCLRRTMREVDTVCRLGGDEFILLIEEYAHAADISAIVDRLFGCARRFYRVGDTDAYVTWSCGIAVYPKDGGDGNTLIKHADIAMYRAKAKGSNCAVSYDPAMSRQLLADLKLRLELRHALDGDELKVLYQPQVRASDNAVVLVEALVRWQHPQRGLLTPDEFFGVAMASGLMAEVDARVLAIAVADLAALRRAGAAGLKLAVNVTAQQLGSSGFAERLGALLAAHDLTPDALELEITEATLLDETADLRALFRRLRGLGVRFALDDFGTGFSSLAHLRHFSIDRVKIDPTFIRNLPGDEADGAMLEGVLAIAARLGLAVAAEGVETEAQRDWLLARGCDLQQGFHYGGPQDLARLRATLFGAAPAHAMPAAST